MFRGDDPVDDSEEGQEEQEEQDEGDEMSQRSGRVSQYRGISRNSQRVDGTFSWKAQIYHAGAQKHIGTYDTAIKAARAYDKEAKRLHGGDWDYLNFPQAPSGSGSGGSSSGAGCGGGAGCEHASCAREILMDLFTANDGANWPDERKVNWGSDVALCDWAGIEVDAAGNVTSADLSWITQKTIWSRYLVRADPRRGLDTVCEGQEVEVRFEDGLHWYTGGVEHVHGDGTLDIAYADGDFEARVPLVSAAGARVRRPIGELVGGSGDRRRRKLVTEGGLVTEGEGTAVLGWSKTGSRGRFHGNKATLTRPRKSRGVGDRGTAGSQFFRVIVATNVQVCAAQGRERERLERLERLVQVKAAAAQEKEQEKEQLVHQLKSSWAALDEILSANGLTPADANASFDQTSVGPRGGVARPICQCK